jgi:regulator of sirC expression with transglutaminase-like and TPR domain
MGAACLPAREAFIQEVSQPDEDINLLAAGLLLAAEEYPGLDLIACQGRVALLAQRARAALTARHSVYDAVHAINQIMFDEEGFRGNAQTYYDPRNSYLNEVLDRRLGIPITLAVIYQDVARRLGHRLRGIGMASHFLLAAGQGASEIYVDPFNNGGLLSRREGLALALRGQDSPRGTMAGLTRRLLPVFDKRATLRRMLNNLKQIYLKEKDYARALAAAERMNMLEPNDWRNLSDLARVQAELGRFSDAAESLSAFIERAPAGTDIRMAENALKQLKSMVSGAGKPGAAPA